LTIQAEHIQSATITRPVFESLFKLHYAHLCAYAHNFLKDVEAAEEVVQEVLFKLWVNRETIDIDTSLQSYLFRAVRNTCLNHLKHNTIRNNYKVYAERQMEMQQHGHTDELIVSELEQKIRQTIEAMPLERRKIFIMSRYDNLKYKEIADKLGISVKTVENQMGSALKFLRDELKDYLPWVLLFFGNFFQHH
jgi:RNA polymerase sigma-70 factor, ECF subfamily